VSLRRSAAVVGGIAALAGAVVLLLVAVDARAWSATVRDDDQLFRVAPARATWAADARAPFGLSERLLGTADDVRLRRAVQAFQVARLRTTFVTTQDPVYQVAKAKAQLALVAVQRQGPSNRDRSIAANLLGVLAFQEARLDPSSAQTSIRRAALAFRRAILWDDTNEDAKSNLELVLRLTQAANQVRRDQAGIFGNARGHGTGAGRGGTGY
jgi:hypothetical protein